MAKFQAASILALSLCLFSLLGFASCHLLEVEGKVYCDTCRIGFETRLSEPIEGAKVKIECHSLLTGQLSYTEHGITNKTGGYKIRVKGDHEEEICEVVAVSSPRADCNTCEPGRDRARVCLTKNVGIASLVRLANPLGFMKRDILGGCISVLQEMGLGK